MNKEISVPEEEEILFVPWEALVRREQGEQRGAGIALKGNGARG